MTLEPHTVFLVEELRNPSTDYYILPALAFHGCRIVRCTLAQLPSAQDLDGSTVIFVRYLNTSWVKLVNANRSKLRHLIYFMDDDILDLTASAGMPWEYRFRLFKLATRYRNWLQKQAAELWVSSEFLLQKYDSWKPTCILPSPLPPALQPVRVFYHGSPATHQAEIAWLKPVIAKILDLNPAISFEIVGGPDVKQLYQGLDRVNIIHSMKWPSYCALTDQPGRHIGLAPQLDLPFNHARSYVKLFDITRCGAVGIYATHSPCSNVVNHGVDGIVADMVQEEWISAIVTLAADENKRLAMLENAVKTCSHLANEAESTYRQLL